MEGICLRANSLMQKYLVTYVNSMEEIKNINSVYFNNFKRVFQQ